MVILFIGDMHLDHVVGRKTTLDFFKQYSDKLIELANTVDVVVLAGDYFRRQDADNPYRRFLTNFLKQIKTKKMLMLGQHDRDMQGHVLEPIADLSEELNMVIVENVAVSDKMNCTFISHDRNAEALKKKILDARTKYVFGHFNINGYDVPGKRIESAINLTSTDRHASKFYLGDIHKRQTNDFITYVGSVAPTNIGEVDYDFAVLLIDTETGKETWKKFKYDTRTLEIKGTALEPGDYTNTRLIVNIKTQKEKVEFLHAHPTTEFLSLEFVLHIDAKHKTKVDLNLNFKQIVTEYLKMVHKENLQEKIFAYLQLVE